MRRSPAQTLLHLLAAAGLGTLVMCCGCPVMVGLLTAPQGGVVTETVSASRFGPAGGDATPTTTDLPIIVPLGSAPVVPIGGSTGQRGGRHDEPARSAPAGPPFAPATLPLAGPSPAPAGEALTPFPPTPLRRRPPPVPASPWSSRSSPGRSSA